MHNFTIQDAAGEDNTANQALTSAEHLEIKSRLICAVAFGLPIIARAFLRKVCSVDERRMNHRRFTLGHR